MAAQLLAALAAARRGRELAELIGTAALSDSDRRYQQLERAFETELVNQGSGERRSLAETLNRAWQVLGVLPRRDLVMLSAEALDAYYPDGARARAAGEAGQPGPGGPGHPAAPDPADQPPAPDPAERP